MPGYKLRHIRLGAAVVLAAFLLFGCSDDESGSRSGSGSIISLTFSNPMEIEVDSDLHQALLLHNRQSPSGPALQFVDIDNRQVLATKILDLYDVYDVEFVSDVEACIAVRPQGNLGYGIQFVSLPDLTLGELILTAGLEGSPGYMAVDREHGLLYYSHAGGGDRDGVYRININTRTLMDADMDGEEPFGFDNELTGGEVFHHPGRLCYNARDGWLVVANLEAENVTLIDPDIWGTLNRDHPAQPPRVEFIETTSGELNGVYADAMDAADGVGGVVYVFAGTSEETPYLSRFGVSSVGIDFIEKYEDRVWSYGFRDICVHAREDIFSVFVLQTDSTGTSIGQFRLNNLVEVADSPHRPRYIPDEDISTVGIDVELDKLIVGDAEAPRLELISIE